MFKFIITKCHLVFIRFSFEKKVEEKWRKQNHFLLKTLRSGSTVKEMLCFCCCY